MSNATNCYCEGACFARSNGKCTILHEGYVRNCPFQKKDPSYTKGKYYPYVDFSKYTAYIKNRR